MVVRALYFLGLCNRPRGQADQRKHNLCGRSLHTGSHNGNHGSDTYAEKPQAGQASQQRRKVAWHYIRPQTGRIILLRIQKRRLSKKWLTPLFLIFSNNMDAPMGKQILGSLKNLNAIDFRWTKSIIDNRCCAI